MTISELHAALDAAERSGRTSVLRAVSALLQGFERMDAAIEPPTVPFEYREIPELELDESAFELAPVDKSCRLCGAVDGAVFFELQGIGWGCAECLEEVAKAAIGEEAR